jgi:hypothetical protein
MRAEEMVSFILDGGGEFDGCCFWVDCWFWFGWIA